MNIAAAHFDTRAVCWIGLKMCATNVLCLAAGKCVLPTIYVL